MILVGRDISTGAAGLVTQDALKRRRSRQLGAYTAKGIDQRKDKGAAQ